ncbi:hypothetical protein OKW49_008158 [Paraburkholderia youngii]|uniref:DUF3300 domain-containing protein n=1 Tax=Paraburkholderia youngii TaxID=2782701 RepID=UPI003D206A22
MPEQLQQLVAPIELYPDVVVAQILVAANDPVDIVAADRGAERRSAVSDTDGRRRATAQV